MFMELARYAVELLAGRVIFGSCSAQSSVDMS